MLARLAADHEHPASLGAEHLNQPQHDVGLHTVRIEETAARQGCAAPDSPAVPLAAVAASLTSGSIT